MELGLMVLIKMVLHTGTPNQGEAAIALKSSSAMALILGFPSVSLLVTS